MIGTFLKGFPDLFLVICRSCFLVNGRPGGVSTSGGFSLYYSRRKHKKRFFTPVDSLHIGSFDALLMCLTLYLKLSGSELSAKLRDIFQS